MSVFVSVGTTRFDLLIDTVLGEQVQTILKEKGYHRLVVQFGKSEIDWEQKEASCLLELTRFAFSPSLSPHISSSSLVISHAGAGTCLEVQAAARPHVVVVNRDLMDNHQAELAEKLSELGHLRHCVCDTLAETLGELDAEGLRPMEEGDARAFARRLDEVVQDLL